MLCKLQQIEGTHDQELYLQQLIQKFSKNSQQFIAQLNDDLINNLSKCLKKQNFSLWLQLSVILMSIQQCFQYADLSQTNKSTSSLIQLLNSIGQMQGVEDKHEKVNKLQGKYPTIQISVVLLAFYAKYCANFNTKQVKQEQLPRIIPIFVRMSSFIVEKYIQLRNQPAKGTQDRIQDDKVIIKCLQKWVASCMQKFFSNLPIDIKCKTTKQLVLMATCDVIGALMQSHRQNILNKQLTKRLNQQCLLSYIRKSFSVHQISDIFEKTLRSKHFNNPMKKIEIPQIYSQFSVNSVGVNTQACCFIIVQFIKSGLASIERDDNILCYLLPVVSQILSRPYEIKIQAIHMLERLIHRENKIQVKNGFEYKYPIQLFLFYFWQYENEKYQSIRSKFQFISPEVQLQSLINLKNIHLQNLQKQKQKYILTTILKYKLMHQKVFLILNGISFKQQKTKRQELILSLLQKLKQKGEQNHKIKAETKNLTLKWVKQLKNVNIEQKIKERFNKLIQ